MKTKEIQNLFDEPLSDEIERRVVKNKTSERNQTVFK
jgi:hypothetical protein